MGTSLSRSLTRFLPEKDPFVRAELYTWSSAEFRDEYALIYTSRSNPSETCISHYRVNRDKVLLSFQDCLCEGNTVRINMEFASERDYHGLFVFSHSAEESSGRFIEKRDHPGLSLFIYQDIFQRRIGELEMLYGRRGEYRVRFTTGIRWYSLVTYFVYIICDPLKGLEVNFSGPHCEHDYPYGRRPISPCYLNHVPGIPTHDFVKQKKKKNDGVGVTTLVSSQSTGILNTGQAQGNLNESNFRDCKIVVNAQEMLFKGLHNSH